MGVDRREAMLLLGSPLELAVRSRVWGDGGWMEPEDREALDWLTLARVTGWSVATARVASASVDGDVSDGSRWVVVAFNPEDLREEVVGGFSQRLAIEPILVISRAARPESPMARLAGVSRQPGRSMGRDVRWDGPGPAQGWRSRKPIPVSRLNPCSDVSVWATVNGAPAVVARRVGAGAIVTLAFHPSTARDAGGATTALLRYLLIYGARAPVAWLDWGGTLVLRMDDPGGAENVFHKSWCYPKLAASQWAAIGQDLRRRNGRLSILYVAGWLDDGDAERGSLRVDGRAVRRVAGAIHPSPLVRYIDRRGHKPGTRHDYTSEFAGIQALRAGGMADVEVHGYTHVHPDRMAWAKAPDRYESTRWFRELGARRSLARCAPNQHPLAMAMGAFRRFFGVRPTTLVSPGDQWINESLERALDLGIQLVDSYYLAIRHNDRFCWCTHVCSPYLNVPDTAWFESGLPVVGYFHDMEPALEGTGWMATCLDRWQTEGARRFIDFRELASAVGRCFDLEEDDYGCLRLTVTALEGTPDLVRPLAVRVYSPQGRLPPCVSVRLGASDVPLQIHGASEGSGQITIRNTDDDFPKCST